MKRFKCLRVQRHCGRRGSIYIIPCKLIYDAVTRQSLVSDIINVYIYCITSNVEAGLLAIGLGIINRKLTFIKDTPFSGLKLYSSGRTETLIVQGHSINIYGVNETHKNC